MPQRPFTAMPQPGSRMPLQGLRRMIAERMVQVQQTIPDYSYIDDCDVTDLVRMRNSLKQPFAERGVRLTYLPFFVKAITAALAEVPMVNASIDTSAAEIVLHDRYHIGIATETASGLVVPVIRDADQKDLFQIAQEIGELSQAARNGKATADQLRGIV